jgi:ribonuclease HII
MVPMADSFTLFREKYRAQKPEPAKPVTVGGPTFVHEDEVGVTPICGIDEAGRGPLAGPVVAAAVILDRDRMPQGLNDSKKLTELRREALYEELLEQAHVGVGIADVAEIDRLNILQATLLAMSRAADALPIEARFALIDGIHAPKLQCPTACIKGGDGKSLSIAAASIIAKVARDRYMRALALDFPEYGWERNKGYGSAQHMTALHMYGPTPHHRTSFAPVRAAAR